MQTFSDVPVAIVGAGLAGCGAAHALSAGGVRSVVFEKSRGAGGRTASRQRDGFAYDFGANFFGLEPGHASDLLARLLGDARVALIGDVWTFDRSGTLHPGDPDRQHARWSARDGINRAAKAILSDAPLATLAPGVRVERVEGAPHAWTLVDTDGGRYGPVESVVLTPPAPQAAALVASVAPELGDALGAVTYRAQHAVALALSRPAPFDPAIGALLNADREHEVAWITVEERKAGHAPEGRGLIVVQMAPTWTDAHYDAPVADVAEAARGHAERLAGASLDVLWSDVHRWRYALPDAALDDGAAARAEADGLLVAGDGRVGKGRATAALASGLEVGQKLTKSAST
jgi:predicted NAD/FAD-dependent oxidoreductase